MYSCQLTGINRRDNLPLRVNTMRQDYARVGVRESARLKYGYMVARSEGETKREADLNLHHAAARSEQRQ